MQCTVETVGKVDIYICHNKWISINNDDIVDGVIVEWIFNQLETRYKSHKLQHSFSFFEIMSGFFLEKIQSTLCVICM